MGIRICREGLYTFGEVFRLRRVVKYKIARLNDLVGQTFPK